MTVTCVLKDRDNEISSHSMIETEATRYTFVDEEYVREHQLSVFKLSKSRKLEVIDKRSIISNITHATQVQLRVESQVEIALIFITRLTHYSVVLEIS